MAAALPGEALRPGVARACDSGRFDEGSRQRSGKAAGDFIHLLGGDDQRRQEAHHAAMATTQFEDQPSLFFFCRMKWRIL